MRKPVHVERYIFLVDFYPGTTKQQFYDPLLRGRDGKRKFFRATGKIVYEFSRDLWRGKKGRGERKRIIASTRLFPSRGTLFFRRAASSNFPFSSRPTLVNYPRLPPRLITSSNVRGWSRNFAGNVAAGCNVAKCRNDRVSEGRGLSPPPAVQLFRPGTNVQMLNDHRIPFPLSRARNFFFFLRS